jgi:hypothetical protein
MGGLGSGGWNLKHRDTVEGNRRIAADDLRKKGCLEPGTLSSMTWTSDSGDVNSIRILSEQDQIKFIYKHRINGGGWKPVEQVVGIVFVPCHYGGERTLFLCPACRSKRKYLYGAGKLFLCRACHDLTYASQRERPPDRASRQARKIRRRLGVEVGLEGWIGPKPKGMHQRSFERLSNEIHEKEAVVLAHMWKLLGG